MNTFSIKRIALLMQKSIYENSKNFLKLLAIFFGILVFIVLVSMPKHFVNLQFLPNMFMGGFILLGLVVSGMAFSNLRTKEKSMSYLALPATIIEKLLAELIVSTILYFVVYVLAFYAFNFIMILFGEAVNVDFKVEIVDVFSKDMLTTYHYFIIAQSILFAGAATFMKRPLLSTGFTLFVVGLIYIFYTITMAYIIEKLNLTELNTYIGKDLNVYFNNNSEQIYLPYTTKFISAAKYLFKYALAPIFWVVAYLKLKEKQV